MRTFGVNPPGRSIAITGILLWPLPDLSGCRLIRDGVVLVAADGTLAGAGERACLPVPEDAEILACDGVIAPAFADLHVHWVQHAAMGASREPLMRWLRGTIWPAEAALLDPVLCRKRAKDFWRDLLAAGTTTAAIYAASFEHSVDACLESARGVHVCGNSIMTLGCDPPLLQEAQAAFEGVKRLHARWGEGYAITPRFALNVGEETMALLGAYAQAHGLLVQTHLAETREEVELVRKAFPQALDYADVYDRAGLLGPRTILAHCIQMSEREWDLLATRQCVVAHCPSSNVALGSGRMNIDEVRRRKLDWVLASDIGAGPDLCQFDVMRAFLEQHDGIARVSACEAFAHASVCAVPPRLLPSPVPAQLMVLDHDGVAQDAQTLIREIVDRYRHQPASPIKDVFVAGEPL